MPSFVRRCVRRLICVSFGMIQPFNKSAFRQIKQHSFGYFVALTECKACQVRGVSAMFAAFVRFVRVTEYTLNVWRFY